MSDLIDRQQAIDAIENAFDRETILNRFVRKIAISAVRLLPSAHPELCEDAVSRKAVIDMIGEWKDACADSGHKEAVSDIMLIRKDFIELPPVTPKQPDLSEAYANAVFTWLMSYQIQSAQLKGRYTPYEVIGWVLNDWRKEHDAKRDT